MTLDPTTARHLIPNHTDQEPEMFPIQDITTSKATQQDRLHQRPHTGIRRSARLISIEIRRSRDADHRR